MCMSMLLYADAYVDVHVDVYVYAYDSLQPHAARKTFVPGFRTRVYVRMQTRVRIPGTIDSLQPHAPREALLRGMRMWVRMWMHMWMLTRCVWL